MMMELKNTKDRETDDEALTGHIYIYYSSKEAEAEDS